LFLTVFCRHIPLSPLLQLAPTYVNPNPLTTAPYFDLAVSKVPPSPTSSICSLLYSPFHLPITTTNPRVVAICSILVATIQPYGSARPKFHHPFLTLEAESDDNNCDNRWFVSPLYMIIISFSRPSPCNFNSLHSSSLVIAILFSASTYDLLHSCSISLSLNLEWHKENAFLSIISVQLCLHLQPALLPLLLIMFISLSRRARAKLLSREEKRKNPCF
jgi:hypothetical protein